MYLIAYRIRLPSRRILDNGQARFDSPVDLITLANRFHRVTKFTREAASLSAIPVLALAALARDNPFGRFGIWNSAGKYVRVVKIRTRSTKGEFALIDTHDLGHLISCEEVPIDRTYNFDRVPFPPNIIVDCSAHIGLFTLVAGARYDSAELIAFEPNASNFRMAQLQLARFKNRLRLEEAAVW
jgi:hypothetical protein